jgi:hypothetical protein
LIFFNYYSRSDPDETFFFLNLTLLSHVNPSCVTYEGVTTVHLAWLKGLMRERWPMWRHVGWDDWVAPQQTVWLEDVSSCDACPTVVPSVVARLSHASQIDATSSYLKPAPPSSFSLSLFLSFTHGATAATADFTDAADLPPSPPALELWSSTSPKVMDHF